MNDTQKRLNVGRAENALQNYFIRKLLVPKIYLDAEWNSTPVNVLAIDRAGVGDVHALWMALIYPGTPIKVTWPLLDSRLTGLMEEIKSLPDRMEEIKSLPMHYRYIAIVGNGPEIGKLLLSDELSRKSFAEDGVGRVGILYVDLNEADIPVQVILKPERFRSSKQIVELADQYVAAHTANWEVRE